MKSKRFGTQKQKLLVKYNVIKNVVKLNTLSTLF